MSADEPGEDFGDNFQAVFITKQKPAPPPAPPEMRISLTCYPPLGQLSKLPPGPVTVHTVLDVHPGRAQEPWEVCLWHSVDGKQWSDLSLTPSSSDTYPSCLQAEDSSIYRMYLRGEVYAETSIYFTLKLRHGTDLEWKWVRDETGMDNGIVILDRTSSSEFSRVLEDYIPDLNTKLETRTLLSQSPRTQLWSLEISVPGESNDTASRTDIELGTPWGSYLRWFALVRLWQPWIAPRQGKTKFELDKDAVMCSFQSSEGKHLVVLGLSGLNNVMTMLRSGDSGNLILKVRNDGTASEASNVLVAVGDEFENALASVMYQARIMVMRSRQAIVPEMEAEMTTLNEEFKPEWIEMWYDGLGYCTWNALGQRLTAQKIYDALDTLSSNGINITSLIIDDNWQSIDYKGDGQFQYGWLDFEAEPDAFPDGLQGTVGKIRSKHPQIRHLAVWHALLGYWGGVSPGGKLGKTYKTIEVMREEDRRREMPLGGSMNIVAKQDVHRFYDDFYRFLRRSGVDGVKTDAQFMTDMWTSSEIRRDHIKTYIDAWTLSTLRYFGSRAISCMSQTPSILFYSQLASNRPAFLCRNSDDFFPEIPSSHTWHVWTNAHNALLTQHLNILPDWDMFQTVHDYSGFHAAARCVSGGPIYVTDVPGEHNMDLLKQMTGVTTRGKTVIFRPSVLGKSIDTYVEYKDDILLKVGSYHGRSGTGTPILAIFNISSRHLTELIPLSRFPGVVPDTEYVVRAHNTGLTTKPIQASSAESLITLSLDVRGYEIFTAWPLSSFTGEKGDHIWVGNLGLVGKMASGATIVYSAMKVSNKRVFIEARFKALGTAGFYISRLPKLSLKDDFIATMMGQVIPPKTVSVSKADKHVLEVDAETAWREMGLKPGWSNELELKVYFNFP
ncbi:putative galactinol--sucrose galactosyltransferase 6 [Zalerion maritima]|uniref:Galactinol--sucrose galactosyltransferase 6 n=1 Tax=Zalerion maritima TaxID=339359 RepID=A0AAD5RJD5_9PEZI|nr:putative galactinol--sucrose galactosyltransferase 6 [Zalerion maritima]